MVRATLPFRRYVRVRYVAWYAAISPALCFRTCEPQRREEIDPASRARGEARAEPEADEKKLEEMEACRGPDP